MIDLLWSELVLMPGVRSLIGDVVDSLAQQQGCLVLTPATADRRVIGDFIHGELQRRSFAVVQIAVEQLDASFSPRSALADALGLDGASTEDWRHPDAVVLTGLCDLPPEDQQRWLRALEDWSRRCQTAFARERRYPAVCCVASLAASTGQDIARLDRLAVHCWWSVPSTLELTLLCRSLSDSRDAAAAWRESLAPSLAAGDVDFLSTLWPSLTAGTESLLCSMNEYAASRDWTSGRLNGRVDAETRGQLDRDDRRVRPAMTQPPPEMFDLWLDGLVVNTLEFGTEIHSAAAAVLGWNRLVERRLWRAQSSLTAPMLDAIRWRICDSLAARFGPNWPFRWCQPASKEEAEHLRLSHLSCQWGYLQTVVRRHRDLRKEGNLLATVTHCRQVRNDLAHYRPVSFSRFEQVWNASHDPATYIRR